MSDVTRPGTALAAPHPEPLASLSVAPPAHASALGREPTLAGAVRLAGYIAGALTLAVGLIGLVVHVAFAASARRWLAFPFSGVPPRPAEAVRIFTHNLHALAAVGGLLLIAQSPYWGVSTTKPGRVHRMLQRVGEVLLAGGVAANVIVIGVSLGAYGERMVRATLPHGPVELFAYALALSLYLQGRLRRLAIRHALGVAALSVSALALAAVLETFVNV
jgi:Stage II sporulation protein M